MSPNQASRLGPCTVQDERITAAFSAIRSRGGEILNIHTTVSHSPAMLQAQSAYAAALRGESSIPRPLQQLVILRVCQLNGGAYEWSVHVRVTAKLGVPVAKIEALRSWVDSDLFTNPERVALALADQAAGTGDVDEAAFGAALEAFGARGLVDLCALVAWYVGNTRFAKALGIVPEDGSAKL